MILFVCVHNSGRSQMAEAFFNSFGVSESIAYSAGTFPGENVNQAVVTVMKELDEVTESIARIPDHGNTADAETTSPIKRNYTSLEEI